MKKDFDRIITSVDCGGERFPVRFGLANELSLGSVARNQPIKPADRETGVAQINQKQQKQTGVDRSGPSEPLLPFASFGQLTPALPPTFRQQVQLNRSWWSFDSDQRRFAVENSLNGVTQLVTTFIEQHIGKGTVDALQLCAERDLRQFRLQLLRPNSIQGPGQTYFSILGNGGDELLAFGIDQKGATFGRMRAGALRRINGDLLRNYSFVEQRPRDFG